TRTCVDQNCIDVGRIERGRATAKGRDPLQSDVDVFAAAGGTRSRSESATDLAICRPDLRLVQKGEQARLPGRGRPRRAIGPGNLRLLQEIRYPDGSDGRQFPKYGTNSRARGLRLFDD